LQCVFYCVKTLIDNYPESIKAVTVINAPVYFTWIYAGLKSILPSTVTAKFRIYGQDGWKEALLKDIDSDDLPAYLGGNKTDPDGNPICETFIQRGKPVPMSYYKQNRQKRAVLAFDAEKITLKPFSNEEISFEVKVKNSYLEWEFEIMKGDIDFSLKFRPEISENLESVELIPKQRIDTSNESEKGCFKCERIGIYTIIFDNSYSWLHSKEVYYRFGIRNPENNQLYESK
ncbi:Retinal-binding protein, partial [Araneus ventricosus]